MNILISILFLVFSTNLWAKEKLLLGVDVLVKENFKSLEGRRIGLITNHTGVDSKARRTIDVLHEAKYRTLLTIFSP